MTPISERGQVVSDAGMWSPRLTRLMRLMRGHPAVSDPAFVQLERDNEALIAALRVSVFVVIASVFWWTGAIGEDHSVLVSVGGFGLVTTLSAAVVMVGYFRPWLPWVYATLDIGLLVHCFAVYAVAMRMPASAMLSLPGAWLGLLYLAMAAIRYRPLLVLYTGSLLAVGWISVWLFPETAAGSIAANAQPAASPDATLAGETARFAVILVIVIAFVLTTARTRRSLHTALAETRLRATLSRYFAQTVVGELLRMAGSKERLREQPAAILFVDIPGFTSLAEGMPAVEVAQLLNEYRDRVARPVAKHAGTIDKFIGGGVMVVFGVPRPNASDAPNALKCALEIRAAIADWNRERAQTNRETIQIGIGVHYGPVVAGVLGERDRLEFTVIGDTVNVANRIEGHAAERSLSIVVSQDVLEAAREPAGETWGLVGDLEVRGRRQSVRIYGLSSELDAARTAVSPPPVNGLAGTVLAR